jgi:hypothetical protein
MASIQCLTARAMILRRCFSSTAGVIQGQSTTKTMISSHLFSLKLFNKKFSTLPNRRLYPTGYTQHTNLSQPKLLTGSSISFHDKTSDGNITASIASLLTSANISHSLWGALLLYMHAIPIAHQVSTSSTPIDSLPIAKFKPRILASSCHSANYNTLLGFSSKPVLSFAPVQSGRDSQVGLPTFMIPYILVKKTCGKLLWSYTLGSCAFGSLRSMIWFLQAISVCL